MQKGPPMTTSTASPHVATLNALYGAFGRGDVPAILDACTDDTRWSVNALGTPSPPWWGSFNGKQEVVGFFEALGESLHFEAFVPVAFLGDGSQVAVRIEAAIVVRATGKRVAMEEVHWWTFDARGKVAGLRIFEDSKQVHDAWQV